MKGRPVKILGQIALRIGIAYFVCLAICTGLLTAAYCTPTSLMRSNVEESILSLKNEGNIYHMIDGGENWRLDNFTVAIMLNVACHGDSDPLHNTFWSPLVGTSENGYDPIQRLETGLGQPDDGEGRTSYMRYWHGYAVVLKPLLCLLNLTQIRMAFLMILSGMILVAAIMLSKREGTVVAVLFGTSFVAFNYIVATFSLSFVFCLFIAVGASIMVLAKADTSSDANARFLCLEWCVPYFAWGALTSYLDFLTIPIVTLCIPLGLFLFLRRACIRTDNLLGMFAFVCSMCLCWGLGYASIWASKWVLSSLITHQDVIRNALRDAQVRTGHESTLANDSATIGPLDAPLANLRLAFPFWSAFLLIVAMAIAVIPPVRRFLSPSLPRQAASWCWMLPALAVALLPYAWYLFAPSHSFDHCWFTYRAQLGSLLCLFYVLADRFGTHMAPQKQGSCYGKHMTKGSIRA